jgi:hypothetical protein
MNPSSALRAIVEGTAGHTGQKFFQSLVGHLAAAVGTRYAFVAELAGSTRARTLAFWFRDWIADNIEWDVIGTPCEDVVRGNLCHHPAGVSQRFPDDRLLVEWGIESYLGVPLRDPQGTVFGHVAVFDERPMPEEPRKLLTFRIFAARAVAELPRLHLEQQLRESEERLRDLYEEAPIAYVKEDMERGRFPGRSAGAWAALSWPTGGRFSWMRSAKFRSTFRSNFSACFRSTSSSASAERIRSRSMSVSSRRRTGTSPSPSARASSARTCITA